MSLGCFLVGWTDVLARVGGKTQEFPQEWGQTLGTNWSEEIRTMPGCPKRQQSRGRVHHQALVSPVASDLMSSPLRKRIRSPDLRDALSAGLPGGEKEDFTGGKWGGWQMRAKLRPAVPALDPAPLCSGPLWAELGVGVLGARGPVSLSRWGKEETKKVSRTVLPSTCAPARPLLQTPCSAPPTHTHRSSS